MSLITGASDPSGPSATSPLRGEEVDFGPVGICFRVSTRRTAAKDRPIQ